MENKKKQYPRDNSARAENNNGQRISVRPGNFTPPREQGQGAPAPQSNARPAQQQNQNQQDGQGGGRNRRSRHRRGGEKRTQQGQGAQNAQRNERPVQAAQQPAPQSQNQNQQGGQGGGRNRRNRHRRGNRDERAVQAQAAPQPQQSVRSSEGEEVFSTPVFSAPCTTCAGCDLKKPKAVEMADTEEFAVDIATASYLLDDVPCGLPAPEGKSVEVIGVRFRRAGRVYFFAPGDINVAIGDGVIVDTARGPEFGSVVILKRAIAEKDIVQPLRSVLRLATPEDVAHDAQNREKEAEALKVCATKIAAHKLDMRLIEAQYTFDNSKLLFYFTSEGRVDFRELVRDLAGHFHTRIELRQIGIRDESRLIGGLGMCGRPFCCATFLGDFGQVSVKMAKEQGLSINTAKISGCCGRLMCCLRYEQESYAAEAKLTPKRDAHVETPDGRGVVVESTPLAGTVKVKLDATPDEPAKVYHRDYVSVLSRTPAQKKQSEQGEAKKQNAQLEQQEQ